MSEKPKESRGENGLRWVGVVPVGLLFGLAGYVGISNRSWSGFGTMAALGTFFLVGIFFSDARRQFVGRARVFVGYGNVLWLAVLVFIILSGVELIAFNNADWYPDTFAKKMGRTSGWEEYRRKLEGECGPKFSMGVLKADGRLFVRCNGNLWFDGKTLVFDNDPLAPGK